MRATAYGQSALLLLDIIDILKTQKIPYAIIGAMAVSYYGLPRASMDADAVISLKKNTSSIADLKEVLSLCDFNVIVKMGGCGDPLTGIILIEDKFGNQVDLILGIKGMQPSAFKRIKKDFFQDTKINMIGVEDFIAMKIFAGGQKDINDIKGVLEISKENINYELLRELTSFYGEKELSVLEDLI